jgi:tetraacyldisaccharide 4'-kinase
MNPLSAIFGSGVAMRNALYDRRVFKVRKLARPVVSVGNLSVGGSGKTPFVIALGELLKDRGITFDVLSRGYGRSSPDPAVVDPQGSPAQFGDEPLLIARKLQVPVIVGAERYQAGVLGEQSCNASLHLLDDGFQHRRLHRDFDLVLVPAADLEDTLLPAGRLREPLRSLRRADAVVVHANENTMVPGAPDVWRVTRALSIETAPSRPLAFCGVARPQQFFAQLRDLGFQLAETVAFPDHHGYTESDIHRLLQVKSSTGAGGFITTEKDAINLGTLQDRLQPLAIAQLRLILEDPEDALGTLLGTLEQRCGCRLRPGHEKI